jgi:hypothetical protein
MGFGFLPWSQCGVNSPWLFRHTLIPPMGMLATMLVHKRAIVNGQEVSWIFLSCEHDFVSRVLVFVLSGYQLFIYRKWILFYHCLLVVVMTASRRLVSFGRKLCLFVYYVKHVDKKGWVAKDVANIQWRRKVGQCMTT